ncbi:Outer row dynein assembly protein 16 like protein [Eufriesea mexicana]|uniref:Outer row dynein assembly protein 16 like protein n=1 Tax=Eufriesea mexicana TaxID=516756 RepID=A0A310S7E9_9HYME|nr:Outer row dynein assembly protein 16 like protein [Eufriesea mexicana]
MSCLIWPRSCLSYPRSPLKSAEKLIKLPRNANATAKASLGRTSVLQASFGLGGSIGGSGRRARGQVRARVKEVLGLLTDSLRQNCNGSFDKTVKIWCSRTGYCLVTMWGHNAEIVVAKFSPSYTKITTVSVNTTSRVFDLSTGEGLGLLKGHTAEIIALHYNNDGSQIITVSFDGTVSIWDTRTFSAEDTTDHPVTRLRIAVEIKRDRSFCASFWHHSHFVPVVIKGNAMLRGCFRCGGSNLLHIASKNPEICLYLTQFDENGLRVTQRIFSSSKETFIALLLGRKLGYDVLDSEEDNFVCLQGRCLTSLTVSFETFAMKRRTV